MKKHTIIFSAFLAVLLVLTGCTKKDGAAQSASSQKAGGRTCNPAFVRLRCGYRKAYRRFGNGTERLYRKTLCNGPSGTANDEGVRRQLLDSKL